MKLGMFNGKRHLAMFCGFFLGCALASSAVQAKTLTYSVYTPPSAPGSIGVRKFIDVVQKDTNGDLKFDNYESGELTSGKTTLEGIRNGLTDGGVLVSVYTPSSLPANMVLSDLSFFNTDTRVTAAAVTDTIQNDCPQCLAEYKKLNIHFLSSMSTAPYHAMCKGTFKNGFDPKGLRMRAPGEEIGNWIKEMGGVPVHVANSEAYQALQRNALDCAIGAEVWLHNLSWEEVVGTVVNMPMGGYQGGSLINLSQDAWNGLDAKTQGIVEKAALRGTAAMTYTFVDKTQSVTDNARKKYHIKFIGASDKLAAKRQAFKDTEVQRAIDKARSRGVKNPEKIVAAFQKNVKKWQALIGDKTLSEDQYAQLLINNILKTPQSQ